VGVLALGPVASAQGRVSAQDRLLAIRAARSDAMRQLAETIYGVRIDSDTTVRDFVMEDDRIHTELRARLRGAREVWSEFNPRTEIAEVEMEIYHRQLPWRVRRCLRDLPDPIVAVGKGTIREEEESFEEEFEPPEYDWADRTLEAVGQAAYGRRGSRAQKRLLAERAAQVVADRNLAEMVLGVEIDSRTTVRDFVMENDRIQTRLRAFLRGAKKVDTVHSEEDGLCEVTMAISLRSLPRYLYLELRDEEGEDGDDYRRSRREREPSGRGDRYRY
jgi:hypothetical protein